MSEPILPVQGGVSVFHFLFFSDAISTVTFKEANGKEISIRQDDFRRRREMQLGERTVNLTAGRVNELLKRKVEEYPRGSISLESTADYGTTL